MQIRCSTHSVILNDSHTVHMLTQQHLLTPLTSTVKVSLFMSVRSSPIFLAAKLHRSLANFPIVLTTGGLFLDLVHVYVLMDIVLIFDYYR